jgi:hypothetical protein
MGSFADTIDTIDTASSGALPKPLTRVIIGPKPSAFSTALDAVGGASAPAKDEPKTRDVGTGEAFGRGLAKGVTANFYDELRGLHEAGGAHPDEPMSLYSVLRGAAGRMAGNSDAEKTYQDTTNRERALNKTSEEQHPVADLAGNVAGSLLLPVGGAAGGATVAARAGRGAALGAGYGALAGAGEGDGAGDRATRATTGAIVGGALGGVIPPVVEGAIQGSRAVTAPVVSALRGAVNPEAEAGRRVTGAINRDIALDPIARNRMTAQEFQDSRAAGGTATLMDVGGETTRALARSAANTSPEGRQILNNTINDRFEGQGSRITDWLRQTFHYPDAQAQSAAIEQVAKNVNRPNYQRAMREGDREIMSPEIERLMSSPAVVDAMRRASVSGKDRAVTQGMGGFNPGVTVENGIVNFRRGPNGVPTYPNLQFWDATKRELDAAANVAKRQGDTSSVAGELAASLRNELDRHVPSYSTARAGAAHFFGAQDALEAGQNFVTAKMANNDARQALAKMSPTERQLFQDGFVSQFVHKINEVGDRRNVLNQIGGSTAARERLNIALGPQRASELEATLRVEGVMEMARGAVQGNSTTARQLVELGLAGGAAGTGGVGAYNMDPKQMTYAAIAGAFLAGKHHIDTRLAQRVAEMLTSNDPQILQRGARVVARDARMLDSLRSLDRRISSMTGEHAPNGFIAGGVVPSHADDNKPNR